jgi:hypothetical protein
LFNDTQSDPQLQDGISNNIVTLTKDMLRIKVSRRGIPFSNRSNMFIFSFRFPFG